ncbi:MULTISPECIES: GNAT family N-acetyltransferase [Calothrix]|uniref:GNAT family N-acetyltransferase n=2 Tax=Calothrix TaxID=1186 RepID=A0ABR8A8S8_9CYAN|nr:MULTISPECIES: N-acetyltransferase [Calothrix]MBD2195172.1 GNAT family N-acetyltransferase [Calothrix parietina FACHB-288]MBD2223857.1 GNAT family N-acetyltransferase [Calothrix anomala FACHB-343]
MQLPITQQTKNGIKVELDYMHPQEQEVVRALLNLVILEGKTYQQKQPLSPAEFAAYWLNQDAFVVRAVEPGTTHKPKDILGAFYLKPNFPGRCSHICNAGFIVQPAARGQGIGRLMGESMLAIAAQLGYEAVMFNLVFETNIPSINLWQTLGFEIIGRIPQAAKLADGQTVGALMMYRALS